MTLLLGVAVPLAMLATTLGLAIAFGGPGTPAPMASVNNPFKTVDYSDLPPLARFSARDGKELAFRAYSPASNLVNGSVVLVHGSSASSSSMHVMAKAFSRAGYAVYALDIRGHGDSGPKGHIGYVGQLEDDLEDFVRSASLPKPATLAGFSSGGGFVLRIAGSDRQTLFQNYLLLSPFISQDAPTYRPNSGGWVSVGVPRIIALAALDAVGVRAFNNLPVTRFALNEEAKAFLTPAYSFALSVNFRPQRDYIANIRSVDRPCRLVADANDEVFFTARFAEVFRSAGKDVPVTLVPGVSHIQLTLAPQAIGAAIAAVQSMQPPRV